MPPCFTSPIIATIESGALMPNTFRNRAIYLVAAHCDMQWLVATTIGTLWTVGGSGGKIYASHFDGQTWTSYLVEADQPPDVTLVGSFLTMPDGGAWYAYDDELLQFDGHTWTMHKLDPTASSNRLRKMVIGPNDVLWGATERGDGIWSFDGTRWSTLKPPRELAQTPIQDIQVTAKGVLWVSTLGGGVLRYDGNAWRTYTSQDGLADNSVFKIQVLPHGETWFLHGGGRLSRFDGQTWHTYAPTESLPGQPKFDFKAAPDGTAWIVNNAEEHHFAGRFDGEAWTLYRLDPSFDRAWINDWTLDAAGRPWLATNAGAVHFDGGRWTRYTTADGLLSDDLISVVALPNGDVWFASEDAGIGRYSP